MQLLLLHVSFTMLFHEAASWHLPRFQFSFLRALGWNNLAHEQYLKLWVMFDFCRHRSKISVAPCCFDLQKCKAFLREAGTVSLILQIEKLNQVLYGLWPSISIAWFSLRTHGNRTHEVFEVFVGFEVWVMIGSSCVLFNF